MNIMMNVQINERVLLARLTTLDTISIFRHDAVTQLHTSRMHETTKESCKFVMFRCAQASIRPPNQQIIVAQQLRS